MTPRLDITVLMTSHATPFFQASSDSHTHLLKAPAGHPLIVALFYENRVPFGRGGEPMTGLN